MRLDEIIVVDDPTSPPPTPEQLETARLWFDELVASGRVTVSTSPNGTTWISFPPATGKTILPGIRSHRV